MVKLNPGLSFVLVGAHISLSRKYHQNLVEAGVEGVVLYLEAPPGPIAASRAVICINSIHRVRAKMDVVGMDEMDIVLINLNSEVMSQRGRVLSCLEAAMARAKVVIGMDANIDCARVMEYLLSHGAAGCGPPHHPEQRPIPGREAGDHSDLSARERAARLHRRRSTGCAGPCRSRHKSRREFFLQTLLALTSLMHNALASSM